VALNGLNQHNSAGLGPRVNPPQGKVWIISPAGLDPEGCVR